MKVRWRLSALLVTWVIAVGLLGSWALADAVTSEHRNHADAAMDQRVEVIESAVAAQVLRYVETTTDLAAAIGAQSDLSASDFAALTANLDRLRLPGLSTVSLVVPATDAEVSRVQRDWRARGARQLSLASGGPTEEHLFSVLDHTLDGTAPQTGRDLSVAVEPTQAMVESRTRDQVRASGTYVLLRDRDLPSGQQQQSFVFATPVFGGEGTSIEGEFQGWLLMGMRGPDFVSEIMQRASQNMVAVTLVDRSTPAAAAVPIARVSRGKVVGKAGLESQVDLEVAGRAWQLQVQPTTRFIASLGPSLGVPSGVAGVLLTALLAILVGTLSSSRTRALAKVDSATAALRTDITRRELVEAELREREAELLEREEELNLMALTDSLTGLANRRAFMDQLDRAHAKALRHNNPLYVLFCDVDHFKAINDTYGHAAGDAVLREVAFRLLDNFRTEDTIGRLGGDEFAVICENASDSVEALLARVRTALATSYSIGDDLIAASVSIGIASPQHDETSTQMLERADRTMYQAKAARHVT